VVNDLRKALRLLRNLCDLFAVGVCRLYYLGFHPGIANNEVLVKYNDVGKMLNCIIINRRNFTNDY